jgi:uncharacterized protein YgbK (DUF1537 family)
MKTIVLDDDPSGIQGVAGAYALLDSEVRLLVDALSDSDTAYVNVNARNVSMPVALSIIRDVIADGRSASEILGEPVQFVFRGDGSLGGHIFEEAELLLDDDGIMVFVPADPARGVTTFDGVQRVNAEGRDVPLHSFPDVIDPRYPVPTSRLVSFAARRSERPAISIPLADVRSRDLERMFSSAEAGSILIPDAVEDSDLDAIAAAILAGQEAGQRFVLWGTAPLVARVTGVHATEPYRLPPVDSPRRVLMVCAADTTDALTQLARLGQRSGAPLLVNSAVRLFEQEAAIEKLTELVLGRLEYRRLAVVTSERLLSAEAAPADRVNTIVDVLSRVIRTALPSVDVLVLQGAQMAAYLARFGLAVPSSFVLGEIAPGMPICRFSPPGGEVLVVLVPENITDPDALASLVETLRVSAPASRG